MELIKLMELEGEQAVSARELHKYVVMEAKGGQKGEDFSEWIKRMLAHGFENGFDYSILEYDYKGQLISPKFRESDNQSVRVHKRDYVLTIECAKEIAMLQNNDRGRAARKYFIEVERRMRQKETAIDSIDILIRAAERLKAQQKEIDGVKQEVKELKAATQTRPDYFTIVGYSTHLNVTINLPMAVKLGKAATDICKKNNYPTDSMPDPRFGRVKLYPKHVLKQVFEDNIL